MTNIILQSCSGNAPMDRYRSTVVEGIPIYELENKITSELIATLNENGPMVRIWGMVNSSKKNFGTWKKIQPNDIILFYGKNKLFFKGVIIDKEQNTSLAEELWGSNPQGLPWELLYFIKDGEEIDITCKPEDLGYNENYDVQGTNMLKNDKEKVEELRITLDMLPGISLETDDIKISSEEKEKILKRAFSNGHPKTPEEAQIILDDLSDEIATTPVKGRAKYASVLSRNPTFVRLVKERDGYRCQICGELGFMKPDGIRYAEAHHIEELSKTKIDDPRKMICVCPTCHRVIHLGTKEELEKRLLV